MLAAPPERQGVALDTSTAALKRAARIHPRVAAVGADAWKPLPLRDGVAAIVLSVFAPRNADELARILAPGGSLLAVTPTTRHLAELVGPLGLLSVPDEKEDRLDAQLAGAFELSDRKSVEHAMFLTREEAAQLVRMGPSAWHVDEQSVAERLAALPDPLTVTAVRDALGVRARLAGADAADVVLPRMAPRIRADGRRPSGERACRRT